MGHKLKLHSNRVEKFCLCPVLSVREKRFSLMFSEGWGFFGE